MMRVLEKLELGASITKLKFLHRKTILIKDYPRLGHKDCTHFRKVAVMDELWTYVLTLDASWWLAINHMSRILIGGTTYLLKVLEI